ncbi:MAG: hypothetical protein Q8O87_00275 [bacterium]|nr:hypothetical protein [bacterium]
MLGKFLHNNRGELIIEAIIAISIIVVGLLSVVTLLSSSQSLNRVLSDRYIATYLASEGIEVVKNLIDTNYISGKPWNDRLATGNNYLVSFQSPGLLASLPESYRTVNYGDWSNTIPDGAYGLGFYVGGSGTNFKRVINISYPTTNEMRVNSIVNWTSRGGGEFEINLEDHFYDWR